MYLFQPKLLVGESLACLRELQALLASRFPSVLLVFAAHRELLQHGQKLFPLGVKQAQRRVQLRIFRLGQAQAVEARLDPPAKLGRGGAAVGCSWS